MQAAVDAERSDPAVPKYEPPKHPKQKDQATAQKDQATTQKDQKHKKDQKDQKQEPPKRINGKRGHAGKPAKPVPAAKPQPAAKPEPALKPEPVPAAKARPRLFFEEDDDLTQRIVPQPVTPSKLAEAKKPNRRRARRRLGTWLVFAVVAGLVAGVAAVVAVRQFSPPAAKQPAPAQLHEDATVRGATITWLTQHVSQDARVACDRAMCAALTARGFSARELLAVGPTSGDPFRSAAVVVETPAVLGMFGSSLATAWAPDVLASFGSGPARIAIRVVAPHGAAAYRTQQRLDLVARKTAGPSLLLNNSQINVPGLAGLQLAEGRVDSRVLLALADLAGQQPISIVQFGNDGPGASGNLPLRLVDLAENVPASHQAPAAYVRSVRAYLDRAGNKYRPASMTTVVLPNGPTVLRVDFSAPSPFGVLGTPSTS
jgi:hypothetical protein